MTAYKSRASMDWPAPTCASPSKVVRKRGWCPGGTGNQRENIYGRRASVLERLSQAFARLVSDRPLRRDIIERAGIVPPDQQEDRQPPAPAAGGRGHARARRG